MWMRASLQYRGSFWLLAVASFFTSGLDFVGILLIFSHVTAYGGFSLREIAFLWGSAMFSLRLADMMIGTVERLGELVRTGRRDAMILQSAAVLAWASVYVDWDPAKVLVLLGMLASGVTIFFCLFVSFSC